MSAEGRSGGATAREVRKARAAQARPRVFQYALGMSGGWEVTNRRAKNLGERERTTGVDPDDDAARWLQEHDPQPEPATPKSATKSKTLHRFRQRQQRDDR